MLETQPGLLDRALRRIARAWHDIAASVGPGTTEDIATQLRDCLDGRGGEASARARAARLAQEYLARDEAGQKAFLRILAGFDIDEAHLATAIAELQAAEPAGRAAARRALRRALEPPRQRLLTQFTTLPDGMKFLVDLRATLLRHGRKDSELAALEEDLRGQLAGWFDVGFLELRRIDWTSPANLLERLVGYEAVHQIRSWQDLKNRLDSDRRCYAFMHPRMPDEPLIFVEVAMTQGLADSIQHLLDPAAPVLDPRAADTAIFYSISNCQRGLNGISFGNFLIKHAVEALSSEFRNLRHFATLSPIPGFRAWLDARLADPDIRLLSGEEEAALRAALGESTAGSAPSGSALAALLARRGWQHDPALRRAAEQPLLRLAARYLLIEGKTGRAADPVAHFHLSNGARVERLVPFADTSDKGARESATLMVNYLYDPAKIETAHEAYAGAGRRTASATVRRLAEA